MTKKTTINLQEDRDIGQVVNATFAYIGLVAKPLFKDVLLLSGPFYILAGIFSSISLNNTLSTVFSPLYLSRFSAFYQFLSPAYWLNMVCLLIGWSVSTCIIGNHVLQYKLSGPGYSIAEARRGMRGDIVRVIIGNFLNVLVIVGSLFLFIIPGIYFAVANSLITTIIILDKQRGIMDSFGESRRLVRNNWWMTLLLGVIVGIITSAIQLIFKLPASIINFILTFNSLKGHAGLMSSYQPLFIVLNAIASLGVALVSPISVVASCIYYYSLKERKDHVALMQNIENIGVQPTRTETDIQKDEGDF